MKKPGRTLARILEGTPSPLHIRDARDTLARTLDATGSSLVVVDDDPTGTQTVHGVPVFLQWSVAVFEQAFRAGERVVFVSTNSRALAETDAAELSRELGRNITEAANRTRRRVHLVSRSDSTLRGHFPAEVDALVDGMGGEMDGVLLVPAFFEGGRYTIGDTHWVDQGGLLVGAGDTEFARDPTFGYAASSLPNWVQEKTQGRRRASQVVCLGLDLIRGAGPEGVARLVETAGCGCVVAANAACYDDLEVVALGAALAESRGTRLVYRCAASFVKVRGGIPDRELLTRDELGRPEAPGLIVVGSYVDRTNLQLQTLLATGSVGSVELDASRLVGGEAAVEIRRATDLIDGVLGQGRAAVLYTSRDVLKAGDFLARGAKVMAGLCEVAKSIRVRPGYVIAKGGITSIEIARTALGVTRAEVSGQIIPGVPVWRLGSDSRFGDLPYVVFPGNVGSADALVEVTRMLSSRTC